MAKVAPMVMSVAGTVIHVGLSYLTSGITSTAFLTLISGITANFAADTIQKLSPQKLKQIIFGTHPNDLNHSIKRLFFLSMVEALDNVLILYSETPISKKEKKEAKKIIASLKKTFLDAQNISDPNINDEIISSFLKNPQSDNGEITNYIAEKLVSDNISESFGKFIAEHFPAQIQLCFGEGLKNPDHRDAWVAFQRMMSDEIRDIVTRIEQTQKDIQQDISAIKTGTTGLNETQLNELKKLNELLNDKKRFNTVLNNNLTDALSSIEDKANEILKITTHTNKTVKELIELNRKQERRERILLGLIVGVLAILLVGGTIVSYRSLTRPFNLTVSVHGWKGKEHHPLKSTGTIKITIDNKIYSSDINKEGNAVFMELPYSCSGKIAQISIENTEGMPYFCVDDIITVNKKQIAYLSVSIEGLELAQGNIKDENTLEPIVGAMVRIAGESTYTDNFGEFSLPIPLDKQNERQEIRVYKEGYEPYRTEQPMVGSHDFNLYLRKNK